MNVSAATGDMGILANHVPSIEPIRPGVVEVIDSGNVSKKWFGQCHSNSDDMSNVLIGPSVGWLC